VQLGDAVALMDAGAFFIPEKSALLVKLRWGVLNPASIKPFVHVVCDGALVGQLDGHTWGGIYPFEAWTVGEIQTDYRQIPLPYPYDEARCDVVVGVYDQNTIERLPALDIATDTILPNALVPIPYLGETNDPFPFD
jgi:hypothetical protein